MDKKSDQQYQDSSQMEGTDTANYAYDEEFYEQVRQAQDKESSSEKTANERDASWEAGNTGDQS